MQKHLLKSFNLEFQTLPIKVQLQQR